MEWNKNENSKKKAYILRGIVRAILSHTHFFVVRCFSLRISYLSARHRSQQKKHGVTLLLKSK